MDNRIAEMRESLLAGRHHALRHRIAWNLAETFAAQKTPAEMRAAAALEAVLAAELPAFLPGERIAFLRTVANLPELYTPQEWEELRARYSFSEKGIPFNFTPDYASAIHIGLDALATNISQRIEQARQDGDSEGASFLAAGLRGVQAVIDLAERYRIAAEKEGLAEIAANLAVVPRKPPQTFLQALQMFRILHYALWCEGSYHNGTGRLDLTLWPYLQHDLQNGTLDRASALALVEEFFLTFNRDSDLYVGVQQGDNGQSLMLGGCDRDGNDVWNLFSELALEASCNLRLVDPKINFRVSERTPIERLELGSRLTRAGLGFPQYSNDDVILPALQKWGYALEDARDYTVAACWEFVIPGVCHEFVNLDAISLPQAVLETMEQSQAADYPSFLHDLAADLRSRAKALLAHYENLTELPGPFISMLCPIAIQKARNITQAGKYHNWGVHGTGIAVAADSLTSIRQLVFQSHQLTLADFAQICKQNYAQHQDLLAQVRNTIPKLGQNSPEADRSLDDIVALWQHAWDGLQNAQGGIVRPGTGSAMYYIWHSRNFPATPDGRLQGEPFSANYSPALDVPVDGPLSVIRSFTAPPLDGVSNGGPLTIEIHASVFTAPDAEAQLAQLIADFVRRGGHQLQLNSIDRDTLLDAQKHPENHRDLIVRVWGWSGYFIELDKEYQDHIIRRAEMTLHG
ncbi:MAG: hypothetical protein IJJ26_09125 [Victivallales bacterium]|nr:hypothetical protein [Victivallales bacterium]